MVEALPLVHEIALIVPRCRENLVRKRHHEQHIHRRRAAWIANSYLPRLPLGIRPNSEHRACPKICECSLQVRPIPVLQDLIKRISLDQPSAVDLHPRFHQAPLIDRHAIHISLTQFEILIAHMCTRLPDLCLRRRLSARTCLRPQRSECPHGHIKRAVRPP